MQEVPLSRLGRSGNHSAAKLFCGRTPISESGKVRGRYILPGGRSGPEKNKADGATPDAHDWSIPMAKRATNDDREPKGTTSKRQILKVVGGTPTPKGMSISLDSDVETHIGGRLRAMYDTVLREPVPDRFLDLLRELDTKVPATPDEVVLPARPKRDDR